MAAAPITKDLKIVFRIVRRVINEPSRFPRLHIRSIDRRKEPLRGSFYSLLCSGGARGAPHLCEPQDWFGCYRAFAFGRVFLLRADQQCSHPRLPKSMVASIMARDATDDRALNAAL